MIAELPFGLSFGLGVAILVAFLVAAIRILRAYEREVVVFFGRFQVANFVEVTRQLGIQEVLDKQTAADRERRAKLLHTERELQASENLLQAVLGGAGKGGSP